MSSPPPLALTIGEPAGIGLDITIKAWQRRDADDVPAFLFVGSGEAISRRASELGIDLPTAQADPERAADLFADALPIAKDSPPVHGTAGRHEISDAAAQIAAIEIAASLVHRGAARAIVTNPIHKKAWAEAGFAYPGHTEFLAHLAQRIWGMACRSVMMLAAPDLRVVPVTVHIPLSRVPHTLTTDLIVETGRIVAGELRQRFDIGKPRIAVAGLNPHAGEDGLLGPEDSRIVFPAVTRLCAQGIDARGPLPADTMFHAAARAGYDAALCMYHDQALIPVKTLAFDTAVNVTLGLPFVRTSPDHGTAFDIAGTGAARPDSLIAALKLADRLS